MKKLGKILTKSEIGRLREILNKELQKPNNQKYSATLMMYIDDLEKIAFHKHYLSILYFMKYYRKTIDSKIKQKIQQGYSERVLDIEEYRNKVKQKFHKYTRRDYTSFIKKSEYFFSLYKNPFNLKNMRNNDYLNRTYLGLGFEFLLKAIFLKKRYLINDIDYKLLKSKNIAKPVVPAKLGDLNREFLLPRLKELNYFIQELPKIKPAKVDIRDFNYYVLYGLLVAQNWRNQDIHTPTGYFLLDNVQSQCIRTSYYQLYKLFLKKHTIPNFPS